MTIVLAPLASREEYLVRVGRLPTDTTDDDILADLLPGASRVVEKRLGFGPGMLAPQTGLTLIFDAYGGSELVLRDESQLLYPLRAIDGNGLCIDEDGDGAYDDYALDLNDAWVQGLPVNALTLGEAYTAIRLRSGVSGATITAFPHRASCVRITGNWGPSVTRGIFKERVIGIVRELLDAHRDGAATQSYDIEEAIERTPKARALLTMLTNEYSRKLPVIA